MSFSTSLRSSILLFLIVTLVISFIPDSRRLQAAPSNQVQPTPGTTVTIDNVIQSINGTMWVVGDQSIQVTSQTVISGTPIVGKKAHLIAAVDDKGQLVAQSVIIIIIFEAPTLTVTPNLTLTPTPTTLPSLTPGGPPLTATLTGTLSRTPGGPVLSPTPMPPATSTAIPYTTIVIEGPVEVIDLNVDIVVVYGQRIKLRHDDPLRVHLKVGNWVRINGNYSVNIDQQIVVVAIVIVIIDAPTIIIVAPNSGNNGGGDDGHHGHHGDD